MIALNIIKRIFVVTVMLAKCVNNDVSIKDIIYDPHIDDTADDDNHVEGRHCTNDLSGISSYNTSTWRWYIIMGWLEEVRYLCEGQYQLCKDSWSSFIFINEYR